MKDGGPAFPVTCDDCPNGMSLRDWFAGQALVDSDIVDERKYAAWCYKMADAMLEAREK